MADFDFNDILQKLQVNYGISPYFKVSVGPNPGIPGANSIIISPSGLGLPDRSYYFGSYDNVINAYKQLVRDVVINFRATAEEANKFGSDIFHYEKRIAEITPNSIDLLNPIAKYNPIKVSELKLTAATLPLYDLLSAMYPDANITADTEVLVTSTDYLLSISSIVASTDRTTINSYLMWTLVRAYLPYLSHDFTAAWNSFQSVLFGTSKYEPVQRWEFCANLVKKYMSVAVEYKFSENIYNSSFAIEEMFQNIKKSAIGKLNKYRSMPDLYRHLTRKISGLKLQVGLPVREDPHFLQNYYSRLTILKKNLFTSYTKSVIFSKKLEESRLKKPEVDDYLIELSGELNPLVHYVPSLNTVFVPNNLLSAPVYEENYPRPILYARIGVDIANAVVSSILPYENTWTSELKLLSSFHSIVNDSIKTAEKTKKCMMNFVISKHLTTDNFANTTSLNTVKQVAAVQLAFEALKLSSNINQHIHQPSLEKFEDEALFFISYSQSQCSNITIEQDVFDAITNFKLKKSAMLQTVWNQFAEFPESLNCNSNQQFKCSDLF